MLALVIADAVIGLAYRSGTDARLHVLPATDPVSAEATVVFPGYIMPGDVVAESFAAHRPAAESLIVVEYAQRGLDMAQIFSAVMDALQTLGPQRLRLYGASMGGMCAVDFLQRYATAGSPFGPPVLVLDTVPSTGADVKRPDVLFSLARWYRGGPLATAVLATTASIGLDPPAEPTADPNRVRKGHTAGAWAGTPAMTTQAVYIADFVRPPAASLKVQRVVYLQAANPQSDPLVRVDDAIAGWRQTFPELTVATIPTRDGDWHIPLIERPQETLSALLRA